MTWIWRVIYWCQHWIKSRGSCGIFFPGTELPCGFSILHCPQMSFQPLVLQVWTSYSSFSTHRFFFNLSSSNKLGWNWTQSFDFCSLCSLLFANLFSIPSPSLLELCHYSPAEQSRTSPAICCFFSKPISWDFFLPPGPWPHEDQTPHPISFLSKNSPRSEPARHLYEFTLFYSTFGCQTYSLCILEHTYSIPPMLKLVLLPNGGCT